jgi:signal transduction histidine kinase
LDAEIVIPPTRLEKTQHPAPLPLKVKSIQSKAEINNCSGKNGFKFGLNIRLRRRKFRSGFGPVSDWLFVTRIVGFAAPAGGSVRRSNRGILPRMASALAGPVERLQAPFCDNREVEQFRAARQGSSVKNEIPRVQLDLSTRSETRVDGLEIPVVPHPVARVTPDQITHMVHDLRTALVAIRGYTRMILEERAGPISGTQREYLSVVAENANRMIQQLKELAELAAEESAQLPTLDVRAPWREALDRVIPQALVRAIRVSEQACPEPLLLRGDGPRLAAAFAQLLSIAIDTTDPGGEIGVALDRNGQEEIILRIFKPDVGSAQTVIAGSTWLLDADSATAARTEGGLDQVRETIRLHRGRISVTLKTGEAFTSAIVLPALGV